MNQKYKTEFQALFDAALMFAKRHFEKRLIPFTDVEDVTMEAVENLSMFAKEYCWTLR